MDAASLVNSYFDAIRNRDGAALRRLFAPNAELISASGIVVGAEAIADWYETAAFLIEPNPTVGPLIVDGGHVAVEIDLVTTVGRMPVADVFTIDGAQITRLAIYGIPNSIQ